MLSPYSKKQNILFFYTKHMTYEFTAEQINNLQLFLGRVQLNWTEVKAFNELVNVLSNPIEDTLTSNKTTDGTK